MDNNICEQKPGIILWFTGLSGAGKSTVDERLLTRLQESNFSVQLLMVIKLGQHVIAIWGLVKVILKSIMC